MPGALWRLGVDELSAAYSSGDADPVFAVEELIDRIARLNPVLNAYVALAPDLAAQAEASRERYRRGAPLSRLDGISVAVKDNLHVAGLPTAWGGTTFNEIALRDELPVARLRAAGALIVGKTNTPEFAVEGYTANAHFGVTRNPWNTDLTPGGSSGGSVAALAAGLAHLAIGTDGGGSTRRPAGHTGLYGLKPTIGRIARGGGLPQILMDFEVIGPFARSTNDLGLLYDVLQGESAIDPTSRGLPEHHASARPLRVLAVPTLGDNPCDPQIRAAFGALCDRISALGHEVVTGKLPMELNEIDTFWSAFSQVGLAHLARKIPGFRERAGARYRAMAIEGERVSVCDLASALEAVRNLRCESSQFFQDWDVILTPTAAAQPWPAGESHPDTIDGQNVGPRGHAVYTGWVNASGHPALAIPAGADRAGLPIGAQLVGDLGAESLLIGLASQLEGVGAGWSWPKLAEDGYLATHARVD